ncbi:MAG: sodium:solute symporter [Chthoniobacterales bacterium]|nr:sodium:solute symporter [Chthoniobacterales bacterium]
MNFLPTLDWLIIVVYFAVTLIAGLWMTKRASSNLDEYFLAGRSLPWWLLGIAGMTAWFDMTGTMVITSFLYMLGPRGLFVEFRGGAVLVLPFLLCFLAKWHRRSGCMTSAEWNTFRFGTGGGANAARVISAIVTVLAGIAMLAYLVRGTTLFLGLFVPFDPLWSTLVLIGFTTLYTALAGFYGVVLADLVQGVIILISCVVVAWFAWAKVASGEALAETARQVTGVSEWSATLPAWHVPMPEGYDAYELLILVAGFYLLRNVIGGLGQGAEPRFFAARNDRECGLQCLLQGVTVAFRWPMMMAFAILGIYLVASSLPSPDKVRTLAAELRAAHPDATQANWNAVTAALSATPDNELPPGLGTSLNAGLGKEWRSLVPVIGWNGDVNPEMILPAVIRDVLPTGLRGLLIVALLAALMSTFTSLTNTTGGLVVRDLYQHLLRPAASDRELIMASYLSSVLIVVCGVVIGAFAKNINDLWGWIVMSLTAGAIGPSLLRLYWWRMNGWGIAGGLAAGTAGSIIQRALAPDMNEWNQFLLMTAISFAGSIALSLATRPTPMPVLETFYRRTRPFGWWKPLHHVLPAEEKASMDRENFWDIVSVPLAMTAQVTLFLLPMQLLVKNYTAFFGTLPVFLLCAIALYFTWYRRLPPNTAEQAS